MQAYWKFGVTGLVVGVLTAGGMALAGDLPLDRAPKTTGLAAVHAEVSGVDQSECDRWAKIDMTPLNCLTQEDIARLAPRGRETVESQRSGEPGEVSILVEGPVGEQHVMLRRCRELPEVEGTPEGFEPPGIDPLICNALELMAEGSIPTGHHYTEVELKELMP